MLSTHFLDHFKTLSNLLERHDLKPLKEHLEKWATGAALSGLLRHADKEMSCDVAYARDHYFECWLRKKSACPWECTVTTKFPRGSSWRQVLAIDQGSSASIRKDMVEDQNWSWSTSSCSPTIRAATYANTPPLQKRGEQYSACNAINAYEQNREHTSGGCACDLCLVRAGVEEVGPLQLVSEDGQVVRVEMPPALSRGSSSVHLESSGSSLYEDQAHEGFKERVSMKMIELRERLHRKDGDQDGWWSL